MDIDWDEVRRGLLGGAAPGRRQLFKFGGATILGATALAACGSGETTIAETGTTDAAETTTTSAASSTTTAAQASDSDLALLRTASSIEVLAADTYDAAIATGLVTTPAVGDTIELFRDQHEEHAAHLQETTTDGGGDAYRDANAVLKAQLVDPALAALETETDVITLALLLETVAAETYAFAAGALSTAPLRQAIMAVGGVAARHMAVLRGVLKQPPVPDAFLKTDQRASADALIAAH